METKSKSITVTNLIISIVEWAEDKSKLLLTVINRNGSTAITVLMSEKELNEIKTIIENYLKEKQFSVNDKK